MLGVLVSVNPGIGRSTEYLQQQAHSLANEGLIDSCSYLRDSKTFVFQGGADPINPPSKT